MYSPVQDGIEKTASFVHYQEAKPPGPLLGLVDCFWELKTQQDLAEDFRLLALPDACVNILFNQLDTEIAGVTALRTTVAELNLGRSFHFVGIQLLPGVWSGNPAEIFDGYVGTRYQGTLPLIQHSREMASLDFLAKQNVMSSLVEWFLREKLVVANPITQKIMSHLESIQSVADMASVVGKTPRQLQRLLKQSTGFAPHDLLKVLRMQRSFKQHYLDLYADQSHFIHSFRKITGYTPSMYFDKFNV